MTPLRKDTILIVDDDRPGLAALADGLTRAGYDVIDADNGDDAILLAREHRPDLALLDVSVHGITESDLAYLRAHCQVPLVFLSPQPNEEVERRARELGACAYLVKPVELEQLLPVVRAALSNRATPAAAPPASDASPAASPLPSPEVMMAVGFLMHRFSLDRVSAYRRLHHLASAERISLDAQAASLLETVEAPATPPAS